MLNLEEAAQKSQAPYKPVGHPQLEVIVPTPPTVVPNPHVSCRRHPYH